MTEDEFPWERKEREHREAREEIEEAEAVAGKEMDEEKFDGEIVEEFEIDEAYMCTQCTTLRYGHYSMGCPVCGNKDVAVVTF